MEEENNADQECDTEPEDDLPKYMYLENLRIDRHLADGSYGAVFVVEWHSLPCAAKRTHAVLAHIDNAGSRRNRAQTYAMKQFKRESRQWAVELRHPNIVQFLGLWEKDGVPYIVMELLHKDLSQFLEDTSAYRDTLRFEFINSIAIDVCRAFAYLEAMGVMHRDLKGQNVLLTSHLVAKVSDFGSARVNENSERGKLTDAPGTNCYTAPEAFCKDYGPEVDVFSYGCVLIEILIFNWPEPCAQDKNESNRMTEYDRRKHLLSSAAEDTPALYEDFQPLVRQCLENSPNARPTFARLLQMLSVKDHIRDDDRYRVINANLVTLAEKYGTEDANPKWDDFDNQKFSTSDDEQPEKKDLQKTSTSSASEPFESHSALSLNYVLFAVIILLLAVIVYQHFI